jgi:hypothetical protein
MEKGENTEKWTAATARFKTPFELFYCEGLEDNSGWAGLVRPFLYRVEKYNENETDERKKLCITQIKEKWGSLCIYGAFPENIAQYSDMLEDASDHICERCGSPFHVGKKREGWVVTLCRECAKEDGVLDSWSEEYSSVHMDGFIRIYLKVREKVKSTVKKFNSLKWKYIDYPLIKIRRKRLKKQALIL